MSKTQIKTQKSTNVEFEALVNSLTKEIEYFEKSLMVLSKKRMEFVGGGKRLPLGTRYVMIQNTSNRKIIFEESEISDLLQMFNSGKAYKNFQYECISKTDTTPEKIKLTYKNNDLYFTSDLIDWLMLVLEDLKKTIEAIDKKE